MMKKVLLGFLLLISVTFLFVNIKNHKIEIVNSEDLAVYVNDELHANIPSKREAIFLRSVCDNNAKAIWDNDNWGLMVTNMTKKTKCNLYFSSIPVIFNFDYTGSEQVFTAPVSGTYKLETWGAQGTSNLGTMGKTVGGYGGYSIGKILLQKGDILFINVGQHYGFSPVKKEAYNGGGLGDMPGGGATHIALQSGILSSLENYLNDILIVSGGGGGEDADPNWETTTSTIVSGSGGGFKGVNASFKPGYGGTQTEGGTGYINGTFGKGGNSSTADDSSGGGGGGFYGGGSGNAEDWASGGGGSGYIGNPLLKEKVMYCYNCEESSDESTKTISTTCSEETPTSYCAKQGNGYARITLISIDE